MSGATPLGNMVIKLGLDDADFGKGVANSKKQVRYLAKEMQANMRISDMSGNKMGKLGSRYDGLTKIIGAQEKQVSALQKAYDESFVDGKATESTKRLASQLQDANGKLANYQMQLQNTAGQIARMRVETEGVTGWLNKHGDAYIRQGEKIEQFGSTVSKVGSGLMVGVTLPILASAAAVGKAAISWESSFAGVKKTTDEVVDSNGKVVYSYDDLESSLRTLAMQLPSTHTEIAAVAEAAGQLGINTEDVTAFTKTMIDMGESTNLSAEDAATAIAKIANITGMTSIEYERFGSSVVALGNNFATTEADIVHMANRLASAGTLAGLTNQEILGLATAMSSVGIEAEAGGTAMTQTLNEIEKAVVNGSDELQQFADIAGMTGKQFTDIWKTDPVVAIQSFIKGLGELDSKGESATLVLDELGLSGVRQSNMLKSLALASGTLTDAVGMSTSAWDENTALAEEAGTRYETTESKLKMLRNEVTDAAIEFGGPLVDALRDGLVAVKPLIENLGDLAKSFSSLDKEQQQNIIKWGLMAAAAGPVLKLLGGGISVIGKTTKGVGKLSKGIVELVAASAEKKALPHLVKSISGVGTAATLATGTGTAGASGVLGLGASVAGLVGPIAIGVAAIGTVAGAVYLSKKAYEEHQLSGAKWGTSVTEEQDKVITKTYELREKGISYINEYSDGVQTSADKVVAANQEIINSIQASIDKEYERKTKNAETVENEEIKSSLQQQAENDKNSDEALLAQAQVRVDRINKIVENASKNTRDISDQERDYIESNYRQLSDYQLELAGFNENERIAIQTAYQDDLSKLSAKERETRANNVSKALNDEQEKHEKTQEMILKGTENNSVRRKALLDKENQDHKDSTESMILGLAKLRLEQGHSLEGMSAVWEEYGWTVDEVSKLVESSNKITSESLDMLAKGTAEADTRWNELVFDPKTGEVRTNMADVLKDLASTDEGWDELQFMSKNADISTNAKEEIAVAMGASGKWNHLWLSEKKLLLDGDEAKVELYDGIEKLGAWNTYNADRKTLGIDNADAVYKVMESQGALKRWVDLPVEVKTLVADDPAKMTIEQAEKALRSYEGLKPETKKLLSENTDVTRKISTAQSKLRDYNEAKVAQKHLHATADYSEVLRAREEISQVYSKNVVIDVEYRGRRTGQQAIPLATGTNFHRGGDMIVNDQVGPTYEEAVKYPAGDWFIPQGRNVYIKDAPTGTKVMRASLTKMMVKRLAPAYSNGVGISENSNLIRNLRGVGNNSISSASVTVNDYGDKLNQLIAIMSGFSEELRNMKIVLHGKPIADVVTDFQKTKARKEQRERGRPS